MIYVYRSRVDAQYQTSQSLKGDDDDNDSDLLPRGRVDRAASEQEAKCTATLALTAFDANAI